MSRSPLHLTGLLGLERDWVLDLFEHADWQRARRPGATGGKAGPPPRPLAGRTAALVFHKPSLRTRVSFTAGMHELGGDVVDLGAAEVSENGRESRSLTRWARRGSGGSTSAWRCTQSISS